MYFLVFLIKLRFSIFHSKRICEKKPPVHCCFWLGDKVLFHFHFELIKQNCSKKMIWLWKCDNSLWKPKIALNQMIINFFRRYLNWVSAIKEIAAVVVVVVVFFSSLQSDKWKTDKKKLRWILTTGTLFAVIRWLNFMIEEWLSASRSIITGISHLIFYSVAGVNHL